MTIENGDALVEKMFSFALTKFGEDYDAVILGHSHRPVCASVLLRKGRKLLLR